MSSLDISNRFEITSGHVLIKCPILFVEKEHYEARVKIGTYLCFVEPHKNLYVVNEEWFKHLKQGELKDQKWILRENTFLDSYGEHDYIGVFDISKIPDNEDSHEVFFDEIFMNLMIQNKPMYVSEKGVVVKLFTTLRYSVLWFHHEIVGFYVNLEPYDDEDSIDEE